MHSGVIKTFYSSRQEARDAPRYLTREGVRVRLEGRKRIEKLRAYIASRDEFDLTKTQDFGLGPILDVHALDCIDFLQEAEGELKVRGTVCEADVFPYPGLSKRNPRTFLSKLGNYSFHAGTSVDSGTWEASYWSAQSALSAVDFSAGTHQPALALCRPAGHHAYPSGFGGLCFLNNIAIAAKRALSLGSGPIDFPGMACFTVGKTSGEHV